MNLSINQCLIDASRGSTEPRRLFAARAEAFGREREKCQAMMNLFTSCRFVDASKVFKPLGKVSGAKLRFQTTSPASMGGGVFQ
jgi:hypothetical protein